MPINGPVPDWLFSGMITPTLWVVMFDLGLAVVAANSAPVLAQPQRFLKGLFAVLIAAVLDYFIISAITVLPYVSWRRRLIKQPSNPA